MKKVVIARYGRPEDVVECVEVEDLGLPAPDEVVFRTLAFPINPADLSFCRGQYRLKPTLPATPGAECVGQVIAVGPAVATPRIGDLVINLDRENWAQRRRVKASRVVVLNPGIDPLQAAMIRINPPTARLLLEEFTKLEDGDWIIQNAANSSVGRLVNAFAASRGIRTINVVRRNDAVVSIANITAEHVLVDDETLLESVHRVIGGAVLKLGLDAVAGTATSRIASCLSPGGTLCVYGSMSAEAITLPPSELVYRDLRLRGFILGRHLDVRPVHEVQELYAQIVGEMQRLSLRIPVAQVYPIERIQEAVSHAQQMRDDGKILVAPNGQF